MNKYAMKFSLGLFLAAGSLSGRADLAPGSILTIEGNGDNSPGNGIGSNFVFANEDPNNPVNTNFVSTYITGHAGLVVGTAQPTGVSHHGLPTGSEAIATSIDNAWLFGSSTGLQFTTKPTNILFASGDKATLDFSGWTVTWNGVPAIDMNRGAWGGDPAVAGTIWVSATTDGQADVTFGKDGSNGDTYDLFYTATVPATQTLAGAFKGVKWGLHLTGHVIAPTGAAAPVIDAVSSNLTAVAGQPFSYRATALDSNDDTYVWSASPLPAGAKLVPGTWDAATQKWGATLSWTPTPDQIGHYPIAFSVQDLQTYRISAAQSTTIDVVSFANSKKSFDAGDPVKAISVSLARFDQASSKLLIKGSVTLKKAKNKATGRIVDIVDAAGAQIGSTTILANGTWSLCTRLAAAPGKNAPFGAEYDGLVNVRKASLAKKLKNPCK